MKVTGNFVKGTGDIGIDIQGEGPVVKKNTVTNAQSHGFDFWIDSGDFKVINNLSSYNAGNGFNSYSGSSTSVLFSKNKALYNKESGFNLSNSGNDFTVIENQAKNNRIGGFLFGSDGTGTIENNIASENGGIGYYLGNNNTARKNKALNNMTEGFYVGGDNNLLRNNRAIGNIDYGIRISAVGTCAIKVLATPGPIILTTRTATPDMNF